METRHYKIKINRDRCKGCAFCVEFCPRHVFVKSQETNKKGYIVAAAAQPDDCVNCGLCTLICPDFAIEVSRAAGDADERT